MPGRAFATIATRWVKELELPPWLAFQALSAQPFPIFFDSARQHPLVGRYSYVTADPFAVLRTRGKHLWWTVRASWSPPKQGSPFQVLAESLAAMHSQAEPDLPPFQGGAAGLFGYDLCHHLEKLPRPRLDEFKTPDLAVGLYDWVYAFDHLAERGWLISTGYPEPNLHRQQDRAQRRLQQAFNLLFSTTPKTQPELWVSDSEALPLPANSVPLMQLPEVYSNFRRGDFVKAIRRVIDYIYAGDCFQVNLSQRLLSPLREPPSELYCKLRERNPATFAGYFDLGDCVIASASPERFLLLGSDREIETRPIKGTRPRGATVTDDLCYRQELEQSAKDRAENVMIVDLLRNDLGRVSVYGSVRVPQLCQVESYETVHHLVSVVTAQLRDDKNAVDLLQAAFPGGSVTGAPKIRAMEIISELEPTARGPYCGCMGYIGFDGAMDTNILIRTFTISKGWIQFPVGGGIVADSDPESEYEETLHKAGGMLRAMT